MIVDGIIAFFATIFDAAFNALPPWTPTVDGPTVTAAHDWLVSYDNLFPVTETFNVVKLACIMFAIMFGVWAVMKVVNVIRGAGA